MEPPDYEMAPWAHGPMCSRCKHVQTVNGNYRCSAYEADVRYGTLCKTFEIDGKFRVC